MAEVNAEGQQQALRPPSQSPPRSTMPKRGYLGPRIIEGYDPAIDTMSERIDELEAEIARLRAELASQTFWAELMAGNNCYCAPADSFPGVCAPCAYRQTMLQNKEARRG